MPSTTHPTLNTLPETIRSQIIDLLGARLVDTIDLQLQAKQAHWNVKGPQFIALHKLFDDVAADVTEYVDLIAERIVQLGGVADGTSSSVAERSSLAPYPPGISSGDEHVWAFANALSTCGDQMRRAIDAADDLGDMGTADLFTEISRGLDKWLWFVEAHAEQTPAAPRV